MARSNTYTVAFRRKREGKTDYRLRRKLLIGKKNRLVIRKSLKHFSAQVISYDAAGDKVLISAHSQELAKYGWKAGTSGTPAAFLTGLLLAKKFGKKDEVVVDIGQHPSVKGATIYAVAKGAIAGGMNLNCAEGVMPSDERVRGEHIAAYAKTLKQNQDAYARQFSTCIKNKVDPEQLPKHFEEVQANITK